jgi:hypothetical protein
MTAQKAAIKAKNADFRLDVFIKQRDDYCVAHCLQFDLVTSNKTVDETQNDIIDLCIAHIKFSYEYDNMEYLFSYAPKDVWIEYLTHATNDNNCQIITRTIELPKKPNIPAFELPLNVQEVVCRHA